MKQVFKNQLFFLIFLVSFLSTFGQIEDKNVWISQTDTSVTIENQIIAFTVDLKNEKCALFNKVEDLVVFNSSFLSSDYWNSSNVYGSRKFSSKKGVWDSISIKSNHKIGLRLEVAFEGDPKIIPIYKFAFTLLENEDYLLFQSGIKNILPYNCRLTNSELISNAKIFPNSKITNIQTLNGAAGVTFPQILEDKSRESFNSLMLTALVDGKRQTIVWGGVKYHYFYAVTNYNHENSTISLFMKDPIGRLVQKNEEWWAPDIFYIGVGISNPFIALEKYGLIMREMNHANPNKYDFPTLCGWAVGNLSGGKDINNSNELMLQLDEANKCGLTKYTKVALRLEPDFYCYADGNTQQGWWDDQHWSQYGHLVPPYETFSKWCTALKQKNGIPFTYFQSSMPSDDFALTHPDWMLNNDVSYINLYHRHHQPFVRYDYTDTAFQKHVSQVWKRLRNDGMIGIKFDYPETAWNPEGGFDDPFATTTSAYRTLFELCREGLGPEAHIHERALGESGRPTLDVTAGIVDIQRTAWDNNSFESQFVTTGGLRWYKSRSVFMYYPDSKAVHNLTKEERRSMLTMMAFTSGRLELATPFNMLTPEMVHDISRIYPVYKGIQSPRPIDAFVVDGDPTIYDLPLTPNWHQVALFNPLKQPQEILLHLGTQMVNGGLELDTNSFYYVYDFWDDQCMGLFKGNETIKKSINPLHCALYSIRKLEQHPQLISTNRHILQGWVEIDSLKWDQELKSFSGWVSVIEGEPFKMVIASNGYKLRKVNVQNGTYKIESKIIDNIAFDIITIYSKKTVQTRFSIEY